jgi:hypothetical protein
LTLALVKPAVCRSELFDAPTVGVRMAVELHSPVHGRMKEFADANRQTPGLAMLEPDQFKSKRAAICGAGPSLAKHPIEGADCIFACNSALPYLHSQGAPITAAVGIDQSPGLLREWSDPPDVPYYVASTCDPELIRHLIDHGRTVKFFHSFVGMFERTEDETLQQWIDREVAYYKSWGVVMYMVGTGMTVVSRFYWVATQWLGCERVDLYGADCCLGENDVAHADGTVATDAYINPLIMQGEINGRRFRTRPDMLQDAVTIARMCQQSNGKLRLIGDTLPVILLGKDEQFLNDVSRQIPAGGEIPTPTLVPLGALCPA